ncbi:non-ribosomal peptide synthetase [Oleomonas cavernae]|nr:non-ribosomal peptide synthetase [Oleomonas cavernae]
MSDMQRVKAAGIRIVDAPREAAAEGPVAQILPVSVPQRGMWVSQKIAPPDSVFNIAEYIEIHGALDVPLFLAALRQLADEAETTRTRIVDIDNTPRQVIEPHFTGEIPYFDISAEADPRAVAQAWMMAELGRPVDLAHDPLWKVALFKAGPEQFFWYHRCHHIVLDGFGGGLLARRMAEIYSALVEGREPEPCTLGRFATIVESEAGYRASPRLEKDREYWRERLANLPEAISLAKRRGTPTGGLLRATARLSPASTVRLHEIAKQASGTLPQTLISLLAAYIFRLTGADDLVFGMPVTGRTSGVMRRIPGMMANAVAIRLKMAPELTLAQLIPQVGSVLMGALRHQQYRYEDLRKDLGLLRQDQQISWVGVNIEPFDYDLRFAGLPSTAHNLSNGSVEDLTIFIYDRDDGQGLRIDFDANPGLYSHAELAEHQHRLLRLIESVLADPTKPIGEIDLLDPQERRNVLRLWNETTQEVPDRPWTTLFQAQVAANPGAVAVVSGERALTYRTLNEQANQLAYALIGRGIGPGSLVAVALPRGERLVIALLAILKTGAAYLPLDPGAPAARLALTLEDARPALLLTTTGIAPTLPPVIAAVLLLDQYVFAGNTVNPTDADRLAPLTADLPAYVIYTSGSTGRPKGVVLPHRALTNFLLSMQAMLKLSAQDRLVAVTTIAFDIAALELFLPLLTGAQVVIATRDTVRDPAALAGLITRTGATIMQATPSLWQALLADHGDTLRGLRPLVGGEALPGTLARAMRRLGHKVVNLYGPTETTIWSTLMELDGDDLDSPPIGRPIWNTQVYVLDRAMNPVPVGVPGDLYIGGAGVADGYLNRPDLTAERFLANPFGDGRLYRTGDLARWRGDGVLEFLGRSDFQIKIRGFRVEAGEIEATLLTHPQVAQAVVVLREETNGDKRLVAYVVPAAGETADGSELRRHLERSLPDYMIPAAFVSLDALPVNGNGKLDRGALPAPQWQQTSGYVAPRTPTEEILASLWAETFGLERVGIHDSLFDLGGDSLAAARMIAALRSRFSFEIPLGAVFGTPTIAGLAEHLEKSNESDPFTPCCRSRPAAARPRCSASTRCWAWAGAMPACCAIWGPTGRSMPCNPMA